MLANRDRYLPIKPYIFNQELGDASFQFKNILDLFLTRVKQGNLHFIFDAVLRRITGLLVVLLVEKSQHYSKSECYQLHFSVLAEILFYPQCELYLLSKFEFTIANPIASYLSFQVVARTQ
jgi:hypothetical protein